jgi:Domain of unknown function (DUF4375)
MDGEQQPGGRYWSLVKPVWRSISIHGGSEKFLRQFRRVPAPVGHLFAAHWCQSEVRNGGLHQFFSNSTGVLAPEALEGFRAIGLGELAELLAEAMAFFGRPYPREQGARRDLLSRQEGERREEWDPFYRLDDRFYEWLDAEDDRWERAADAYADRVNS